MLIDTHTRVKFVSFIYPFPDPLRCARRWPQRLSAGMWGRAVARSTAISRFTDRVVRVQRQCRRSRYFEGDTRSRGRRPRLQLFTDHPPSPTSLRMKLRRVVRQRRGRPITGNQGLPRRRAWMRSRARSRCYSRCTSWAGCWARRWRRPSLKVNLNIVDPKNPGAETGISKSRLVKANTGQINSMKKHGPFSVGAGRPITMREDPSVWDRR
jgi:hypothetical protein